MKRILPALAIIILVTSCSLFRKKEKYGCPVSGAAVGAEKLSSGDTKAMKAAKKSKYKGGNKFKGMGG